MPTLWKSSLRYLLRHPLQIILSVIGVAVGVAVVVGIDLSIQSAVNAFRLSTDRIAGNATHQIAGAQGTIDQDIYRELCVDFGYDIAAPVVESYVTMVGETNRTIQLLGIDPLAEAPFRPYLSGIGMDEGQRLSAFMLSERGVILPEATASELGTVPGDSLSIQIRGNVQKVFLLGVISSTDETDENLLQNVMLTDISNAQSLLTMGGELSHIDLIIPPEKQGQIERDIREFLPDGVELQRSESRSEAVETMIGAFQVNLSALSFLALIVGMFLIYNTMTFSVLQRRAHIGRLQSLGVTRNEIFLLVITEALFIGGAGTVTGGIGGLILGSGLVQLVTRTINDLYFVVTVTNLDIEPMTVLKGIGLGIGATLLAALAPAREATKSPPRVALSRSQIESKTRDNAPRMALIGVGAILAGALLLAIPSDRILLGYAGLLPIIMGFALFTPIILISLVRLLRPVFRKSMGLIGGMASQSIVTQLSRSAVAIAALGIAVSATIGVTTSVQSFRNSVEQWLTTTLQADVYISPPGMVSRRNYQFMDDAILDSIRTVPGATDISTSRFFTANVEGKIIDIGMMNIGPRGYDRYEFKIGNPDNIWDKWQTSDAVIISEPYSLQNDVSVGDTLMLPTGGGEVHFPVLGVYFDYGSDIGTALVSRETYHRYWTGDDLTAVALYAAHSTSVDTVIQRLRDAFAGTQFENAIVRSNRALREASLTIFDRTFTITRVLQILTIIVALIGVLSALMALQLERSWEVGIMRAIGLTPGQLRQMVLTQTGLMGTFAGLLAVPLGVVLAIILIYVVNQRSFGWTLQLSLTFESLVLAVLLSIVAAVIAGMYPAIKMGQMKLTSALREE